jgi:hypothetical protein
VALRAIARHEWKHSGGRKELMTEYGVVALVVALVALLFDLYPAWLIAIGLLALGCALGVLSIFVTNVVLEWQLGPYAPTGSNGLWPRLAWFVVPSVVAFGIDIIWDSVWIALLVGFGAGIVLMTVEAIVFVVKQHRSLEKDE